MVKGKRSYASGITQIRRVLIQKEKIERNEGFISIGKLFLNCLRGKFAQSDALKKQLLYLIMQSYKGT